MNKERELELKVEMFCDTMRSDRQICDGAYYKTIIAIAENINSAFNTLNEG